MARRIELKDGKYVIIQEDDGRQYALRHGEPWRDLTGDKMVGAMFDRIEELSAQLGTGTVYSPQLGGYNGLSCSLCGAPQFNTPSGPTCDNGHGGALGVAGS